MKIVKVVLFIVISVLVFTLSAYAGNILINSNILVIDKTVEFFNE
jgi:hypothetical protein